MRRRNSLIGCEPLTDARQIIVGFDSRPAGEPPEDPFHAALGELERYELCRIAAISIELCNRFDPKVAASFLVCQIVGDLSNKAVIGAVTERLRRNPAMADEIAMTLHARRTKPTRHRDYSTGL